LNSPDIKSKLLLHLPTPKRVVERSYGTTVKDMTDVFPDDLPSLPPDRAIEFSIELKPGTAPISRRAY
jgi:hypothetical protein